MSWLKVDKITVYDDSALVLDSNVSIGASQTNTLTVSGATTVGSLASSGTGSFQGAVNMNSNALNNVTTIGCTSITASGSASVDGLSSSSDVTVSSGNLSVSTGSATVNKTLTVANGDDAANAVSVTQGDIEAGSSTISLNALKFGDATYTGADFLNFSSTDLIKGCAVIQFDMDGPAGTPPNDGDAIAVDNGSGLTAAYRYNSGICDAIRFSLSTTLPDANYMVFVSGTQGTVETVVSDNLSPTQHIWQVENRATNLFDVRLLGDGATPNASGHLSVLVLKA